MQCFFSLVIFGILSSGYFIRSSDATLSLFETPEIPRTYELIAQAGYESETHIVLTEDGFLINIFRLLPNNKEERKKDRPALMIQHGVVCSSSDWVYLGKERGLGFALVDLGYDVWLTNFRGNIYGRNTVNSSVSFDFSFHEIAQYDLPAVIDYILENTKSNKLYYIGHSMGTTAFYVLMATKPEYNSKVEGMISLSPVSFMKHVKGITSKFLKMISGSLGILLKHLGIKIILPEPTRILGFNLYEIPIVGSAFYFIFGSMVGLNTKQYDADAVTRFFKIAPVGTSFKVLQHYFQLMDSGRFCYFDYGKKGNMRIYNQTTPPDYNLKNIKVPITLIVGKNDYLTAQKDVDKLEKSLENTSVTRVYVEDPHFAHNDFLWAKDIKELVHTKVISALKQFKPIMKTKSASSFFSGWT